jgi:hypothetical protein
MITRACDVIEKNTERIVFAEKRDASRNPHVVSVLHDSDDASRGDPF